MVRIRVRIPKVRLKISKIRSKVSKTKTKAKSKKSGKKYKKLPRVIKKAKKQTGKSNVNFDVRYKALPPGKRISKSGKVYYEYRKNRSDLRKLKKGWV